MRGTNEGISYRRAMPVTRDSGEHRVNGGTDACLSRTLFRFLNPHRDFCEKDLNRLWWCGFLVIILLNFADPAAVNVGIVQVSMTGPDERNIDIDEPTVFPTTLSGAGR